VSIPPRTKTLRDLCPSNQWGTDIFWQNVETAARMVICQIENPTAVPDQEAIEQMILREWLEFATEAGTA
jgi:hypothetical protein